MITKFDFICLFCYKLCILCNIFNVAVFFTTGDTANLLICVATIIIFIAVIILKCQDIQNEQILLKTIYTSTNIKEL